MFIRPMRSKGLYHVALIVVAVTALNWAIIQLTNVNLVTRVFQDFTVPSPVIAVGVCVSAIIVLWHNWVD